MTNPKFMLGDASKIQRHLRITTLKEGMTLSQAYDITAKAKSSREPLTGLLGHCVHEVNGVNQLVPIPGAITSYVNGRPVIAVPLDTKPEPVRRKFSISVEALCETDGNADEAETNDPDDPTELLLEQTTLVAGCDDDRDEETEAVEKAADASLKDPDDEEDEDGDNDSD